jgi:hypothetical protein
MPKNPPLRDYRCYLLNRSGKIVDVVELRDTDDATALVTARNLFAQQDSVQQGHVVGYEIWQQARLVHRENANQKPLALS